MQSPEHQIYRVIYLFDPDPAVDITPYMAATYIEATCPEDAARQLKESRLNADPILIEEVEADLGGWPPLSEEDAEFL